MKALRNAPLKSLPLLAFAAILALGGCTEQFLPSEGFEDLNSQVLDSGSEGKLRNGHLLPRANKFLSRGKDGDLSAMSLILGFDSQEMEAQKVLERYRVLERYKVIERYRVIERYEYQYGFDGYAIYVEDSLGLDDYTGFLAELADDPLIAWYEPDFSVALPESELATAGSSQKVPWSVAAIGGLSSWTVSGDGSGSVPVDLYVLDTGVSHPDLNIVESIDFRDSVSVDPTDYDGHGTHVAGIAASVDDQDGLVGVAPGARIHNYKVLNDDGKADVSVTIAAVEHITGQKLASPSTPMVVNMSLGENIETASYTALDEAVAAAIDAGVVFVISAGNQGIPAEKVTPAHVADAITVGSYDLFGKFSSFSNHGTYVDILAPGEDILSLTTSADGGGYERMDGTSMATAHVSGAAALYLAQNPSASPAQVRSALLSSSKNFVWDAEPSTTTQSVWVGGDSAPLTILLAVANGSSPSSQDLAKKSLFESWGHNVIVVDDEASSSTYNAAIAQSDVAYVSEESVSSNVNSKLTYASIGVVNEEAMLTDDLGISNSRTHGSEAGLAVSDAAHYITSPFSGSVTLFNSSQPMFGVSGTLAPGLQILASTGSTASLAVLEAGALTYNVGAAAGRRVQLPFGGNDLNISELTADGTMLLRRAIEWAADGDALPTLAPSASTFERRVSSGDDDAEERLSDGDMYMDSSDLELVNDGSRAQYVGMRFEDIHVPQGVTVTSAYIQFAVDETDSGETSVTVRGQAAGNAGEFSTSSHNLSSRPTTNASTSWTIESWSSTGEAGLDQRTPDLSAIVQEIVNRGDWSSGNAMAFFVSGSGERTAESYNGDSSRAPLLHIEYSF